MVASMMPGSAKMMLMSCSCSQTPNQPCRPNSSTKTMPEITGEIGERQVDERDEDALAAEFELGDGPGGREAEHAC